jgi:orotate phosphoribosyltransferase
MLTLPDELVKFGAVRYGDFKLSTGQSSKVYVDIKYACCYPLLLDRITEYLSHTITRVQQKDNMKFDYIGGIELGSVPIATVLSLKLYKPLIIIRKENKTYGTQGRFIGKMETGKKVLVIEDVITTGASSLKAIKALRDSGMIVEHLIAFVNRDGISPTAFDDIGVKLDWVFRLENFKL